MRNYTAHRMTFRLPYNERPLANHADINQTVNSSGLEYKYIFYIMYRNSAYLLSNLDIV